MNGLTSEYLDFVPGKMTNPPKEIFNNAIFVFSRRKDKKIYKKKHYFIGTIVYQDKIKEYVFVYNKEYDALRGDTLMKIGAFLDNLNNNKLVFDPEAGEIHPNK